MIYLAILTAAVLLVSFYKDKQKTYLALKKAYRKFINMLVPLLFVIIIVSFALYFVTGEVITEYLSGNNLSFGVLIASLLGSISVMPGFIAFPLGGNIEKQRCSLHDYLCLYHNINDGWFADFSY